MPYEYEYAICEMKYEYTTAILICNMPYEYEYVICNMQF